MPGFSMDLAFTTVSVVLLSFIPITQSTPTVIVGSSAYTTVAGQSVTLDCIVLPPPTMVFWQRLKGGVATALTIDGIKYQGSTVANPSLTITSVSKDDSGNYTCYATYVGGTGTSPRTSLVVTGDLPDVTISMAAYTGTQGQTVHLICVVSASPTHTAVYWQRVDNGVVTNLTIDGVKYQGATVALPTLSITNINSDDSASYICSATNAVGTGSSGSTTLTVLTVPTLTVDRTAYTVTAGSNTTLGCNVTSVNNVTLVFWQRVVSGLSSTIVPDNLSYSGSSVDVPSLTVISASTGDSGTYVCHATNNIGTGNSATITLAVSVAVPNVSIGQSTYSGTEGNTFTLHCSVSSAVTVLNVFWRRTMNGVTSPVVIDNVNFAGSTVISPSLTIITAETSDSASYSCFASNTIGTGQSAQIKLIVSKSNTGTQPTGSSDTNDSIITAVVVCVTLVILLVIVLGFIYWSCYRKHKHTQKVELVQSENESAPGPSSQAVTESEKKDAIAEISNKPKTLPPLTSIDDDGRVKKKKKKKKKKKRKIKITPSDTDVEDKTVSVTDTVVDKSGNGKASHGRLIQNLPPMSTHIYV